MNLEIIPFREDQLDTVYEIQRAAFFPLYEKYRDDISPYLESRETVLRKYTRAGTFGYLFLKDQIPVGAVRIIVFDEIKVGRISALCVLPQYQGQGIAQAALRQIEALHRDVRKWKLDTILQEPGNCHLYEKLGYVKTGETEQINEQMTIVYYKKELSDR